MLGKAINKIVDTLLFHFLLFSFVIQVTKDHNITIIVLHSGVGEGRAFNVAAEVIDIVLVIFFGLSKMDFPKFLVLTI
ncbi:hypothetical protein AVI52_16335 (plasmid) [Piscirickettsia salmonis]|nr:hypothetical protein AVI52_16335 [Piscirickettsia salmonis]